MPPKTSNESEYKKSKETQEKKPKKPTTVRKYLKRKRRIITSKWMFDKSKKKKTLSIRLVKEILYHLLRKVLKMENLIL